MSKNRLESTPGMTPREEILRELREARRHLKKKALRGKIFDESKERIRQTWANLWIKSLTAEAAILKDVEIDDLALEVEKLKQSNRESNLERLRRIERDGMDR